MKKKILNLYLVEKLGKCKLLYIIPIFDKNSGRYNPLCEISITNKFNFYLSQHLIYFSAIELSCATVSVRFRFLIS